MPRVLSQLFDLLRDLEGLSLKEVKILFGHLQKSNYKIQAGVRNSSNPISRTKSKKKTRHVYIKHSFTLKG